MAVEKKQADSIRWTFGQETAATGSPISDRTDLQQRSYVATSFTVDENGEKIQSDSLRAGYSSTFGELNGLFADGQISMEIPEHEGLLPVLQGILGDRNPVSTALPSKTILPAGTPLTKFVCHNQNLFGQGNKQILDNLNQYSQAMNITISPSSAALIKSTTPGTVVIVHEDSSGTETTITKTFASAALTTDQTATIPANQKVTKVTTTGFASGTFEIAAEVPIVAAHDLTTTAITLSDTLSTHPGAVILILTPTNDTTLTSAETPGTVTFTYTVSGTTGNQTKEVSFANTVKTAAQTIELPAGTTLVSAAVAGFSAGNMDIDATFPLMDKGFFQNKDNVDVSVVKDSMITGTIAVADDLSGYDTAQTLTVFPAENADLSNAATPATVTINYNEDGTSKSGTLDFTDGVKTDSQTFSLPAESTITSVTTAGWSAGTLAITTPIAGELVYSPDFNRPGQLRIQCTTQNPSGEFRVRGLRKVGISSTNDLIQMNEDLALTSAGSQTTDITMDKYFARLLSIEIDKEDGEPLALGTITLSSVPGKYSTVIKVADQELPKHTIEAEVADIPRLIEGAQFVSATINNETTLSVDIDVLARRSDRRRTVEGGWDEKFVSTMQEHSDEFPFVSIGFFTGIGGYIEIDGDAVVFDSSPITISSNYGDAGDKVSSIFRGAPERQDKRQVTCTVSAKYEAGSSTTDTYVKWDQKYRDNSPVDVKIVQYKWADDGEQKEVTWRMPHCEITAPVRVEVTAPGPVPISIALKATPDPAATETAEITCTIVNDDQAT